MLGEAPRAPHEQPSERAIRYVRVSNSVSVGMLWTPIAATVLGVCHAADAPADAVASVVIVALAALAVLVGWFIVVLPPLALRFRRHEIRSTAVFIQRGFLTRRRAIVPLARVQFVTSRRGPIERKFGLGTVVLQTAAGSEFIAFLDDDELDGLQERISDLARRSSHDI